MTFRSLPLLSLRYRLRGFTETALLIRVPEANRTVSILAALAETSPPPHVTIAYPFPPAAISNVYGDVLEELFARHADFDFTLHSIRRFDTVAYLAPSAADRFAALVDAVQDRFPGNPLYGGEFETFIPHLSLGAVHELTSTSEQEVSRQLPIRACAQAVELWSQRHGRWTLVRRFPLAPLSSRSQLK